MASGWPEVPRNLTPANGAVFAPTALPLLQGYVQDADRAFCRLWRQNKMIWSREMTSLGSGNFKYQMVNTTINEVKEWTFSAGVTGGTFALKYHDVITAQVPFINDATLLPNRALVAISNHPDFNDQNGMVWTYNTTTRKLRCTFQNSLGHLDLNDMDMVLKLTGTSPTVTGSAITNGTGDLPDVNSGAGEYQWDMIGYKSSTALYSKGYSVARNAISSGRNTFFLDTTPTVTMDTGTNKPQPGVTTTVNTSTVPFSWQVTSLLPIVWQEVNLVNDATNQQIDIMPGAGITYTSTDPAIRGYTLPYARIAGDGTVYRWSHRARSASGLTSFTTGKIKLVYTPAATLSGATLTILDNNERARLTWPKSTDVSFVDYVVRVRRAGVAFTDRGNVPIERVSDVNQLSVDTYEYRFNVQQVFSVVQRVLRAGEIIESAPVEWSTMIPYTGIHLSMSGPAPRATISFPYHTGRSIAGTKENILVKPWGSAKPVAIMVSGNAYEVNFTAKLGGDYPALPFAAWETTKAFSENAGAQAIYYRDSLGDAYWTVMDTPKLTYNGGGEAGTLDVNLKEINFASVTL